MSRFRPPTTARSRRNRRSVGASKRMVEEGTDLIRRFRREYVFELASLLLDLGFAVHGKRVCEQPLRQPMAPNDIRCPLMSTRSKLDNQRSIARRKASRL